MFCSKKTIVEEAKRKNTNSGRDQLQIYKFLMTPLEKNMALDHYTV